MWKKISPRRRRPAILALHDVRDRGWLHGFLQGLLERAEVTSLRSLVDDHLQAAELQPRFAITFDDGYKSIRTIVRPVCAELRVPYTTFVCGDVLTGGPVPWYERVGVLVGKVGASRAAKYFGVDGNRIKKGSSLVSMLKQAPLGAVVTALERAEADESIDVGPLRERYMDLDDLAVVARDEFATIGSHTHRHPILTNLRPSEQRAEIEEGIAALRRACPAPIEFFAYPNGKPRDYDDTAVAILRQAGIRAAVTTMQRPLSRSDDAMQLPRLGVSEGDSVGKLDLKWTLPWFSAGDLREEAWRRESRALWSTGS